MLAQSPRLLLPPASELDRVSLAHRKNSPTRKHQALLTDAQGVPVFETPYVSWQTAILLAMRGAEVVDCFDDVYVMAPSGAYKVPSVLRWPELSAQSNRVPVMNIQNLMLRDLGVCAYTGVILRRGAADPHYCATIEHLVPQAQGGSNLWSNVVLASAYINGLKGNRTPKQFNMALRYGAWVPTVKDLVAMVLHREKQFYERFAHRITLPVAPRAERHYDALKSYLWRGASDGA